MDVLFTADVSLTVDDWGQALVDDAVVVDSSAITHAQDAGAEGGHLKWSQQANVLLSSGSHTLSTNNQNIDYSDPSSNIAYCGYSVSARPLVIQKDGTWYTYGWDLTKNICEVFGQNGYIRNTYAYTPYGNVTASGDVTQPIQWSSEYYNNELALVCYNYRHYNPTDGRWINRDLIAEQGGWNLYGFVGNKTISLSDTIGNGVLAWSGLILLGAFLACALHGMAKAVNYSPNDKRQHCYTTCYMAINCGSMLIAVPVTIAKEILDTTYH